MLSADHRSFNMKPAQNISKNLSLPQDVEQHVHTVCLKRLTDHIYSKLANSISQGRKKKKKAPQNQSSDDKFLKLL